MKNGDGWDFLIKQSGRDVRENAREEDHKKFTGKWRRPTGFGGGAAVCGLKNTRFWTVVRSDDLSLDCWDLWADLWDCAIFSGGAGAIWADSVFCIQCHKALPDMERDFRRRIFYGGPSGVSVYGKLRSQLLSETIFLLSESGRGRGDHGRFESVMSGTGGENQ